MSKNFAEDYVDVAERIRIFRDLYPEGSLRPVDPARPFWIESIEGVGLRLVYVAAAFRTPDDPAPGIGCAWEPLPGRTPFTKDSELMVAETSAWGRAIVAALAADTKRVASADEVRARQAPQEPVKKPWTADLHDRALRAIPAADRPALEQIGQYLKAFDIPEGELALLNEAIRESWEGG